MSRTLAHTKILQNFCLTLVVHKRHKLSLWILFNYKECILYKIIKKLYAYKMCVYKLSSVKLYLSRKKGIIQSRILIFFKVIHVPFNTLIQACFPFVKVTLKFPFWYMWSFLVMFFGCPPWPQIWCLRKFPYLEKKEKVAQQLVYWICRVLHLHYKMSINWKHYRQKSIHFSCWKLTQ